MGPSQLCGRFPARRPETGDPALPRAGEAAAPCPGCSGSGRYAAPAPLRTAPTCGAVKLPEKQRNPQAGGKGERRGCGKAPSFIFPGRAGSFLRCLPLPETDAVWRTRSSASPGPPPPAAPQNRHPERTEPRSAPRITGDEPSGAALRLWFWDFFCCYFFFVFLLPALIFLKHSGAAGARRPGRCAARGSASPPGPAPGSGPAFPRTSRSGLLLEGGLDFQPVSLLGETLWWGTTLYLFFFFPFLFFFLAF